MTNSLKQVVRGMLPESMLKAIRRVRMRQQPPVSGEPKSYHDHHIDHLEQHIAVRNARVLVVGCNTGLDCKRFIDRGAGEVHGLDVVSEVGREYPNPAVTYHHDTIEACKLPADYFDVTFAVATFEHVPNIAAGWQEMVRVAKPRGVVFSVASPLWESPYGHHMGCFDGHPWIHLALNRGEIIEYSGRNGITGERGYGLEGILDYMLNPEFFNMRPARDYLEAAKQLKPARLVINDMAMEDARLLEHPLGQAALRKGYLPESLLAVTHTLVATKR